MLTTRIFQDCFFSINSNQFFLSRSVPLMSATSGSQIISQQAKLFSSKFYARLDFIELFSSCQKHQLRFAELKWTEHPHEHPETFSKAIPEWILANKVSLLWKIKSLGGNYFLWSLTCQKSFSSERNFSHV